LARSPHPTQPEQRHADGGDGYTVFKSCTDALGGEIDLDAFARYLGARTPVTPPPVNRIEKVG
jgi:5'-nucleotidase